MSAFQDYVRKPEIVQARQVNRPELVQTKTGLARVKPPAWLVLRDDGRCDVWSDRAFQAAYEPVGDSTDQLRRLRGGLSK